MDDQYGQLIEPSPVKFAFGAPGWYVVGAIIFLLLIITCWLLWRHHIKNRYRKNALQWLALTSTKLAAQKDYTTIVYESNMLIKRIAMARYSRPVIAGMRGMDWIDCMNLTCPKASFNDKDEILLNTAIYKRELISEAEANSFVDKTRQWISRHKRQMPLSKK
jgi:hypothetical protein